MSCLPLAVTRFCSYNAFPLTRAHLFSQQSSKLIRVAAKFAPYCHRQSRKLCIRNGFYEKRLYCLLFRPFNSMVATASGKCKIDSDAVDRSMEDKKADTMEVPTTSSQNLNKNASNMLSQESLSSPQPSLNEKKQAAERARRSEEMWDTFVPERKMTLYSPAFYILLAAVIVLHLYNNHVDSLRDREESTESKLERQRKEDLYTLRRKRGQSMQNSGTNSNDELNPSLNEIECTLPQY
ncbi:hypothetical protein IE077_004606 [Cardiosporidium cionae]|uniref:Uncharacterized protein n=1 Tax=Cardiosporidium cionae TaxID=476202 RepID=A0ABQ7JE67_9APIC|nr:hypothetical protein IE077_004606 [Cardiosporidium cionae]|eukprot:KAF8822307.1 hypothetical protein IE077_004606 [Cardiosporidium cionae]